MKIIYPMFSVVATATLIVTSPVAWAGKTIQECQTEFGVATNEFQMTNRNECIRGAPDYEGSKAQKEEEDSNRAAVEAAAAAEAEAKQAQEDLIKKAPMALRKFSKDDFCVLVGQSLRDDYVFKVGPFKDGAAFVKLEATRRKLMFDSKLTRSEQIRIGISECQLYASWGYPGSQNRSVGSWGVHIQHVYGKIYVYTENGRVTSYQD